MPALMTTKRPAILLVGPLPPPLGGVSTHVQRLVERLSSSGLDVAVLNHFGEADGEQVIGALHRNPLRYWRAMHRAGSDVVHVHYGGGIHYLLAAAAGVRRRGPRPTYAITLHGRVARLRRGDTQLLWRTARWALTRFDVVVSVGPAVTADLDSLGGPRILEITPYIAPDPDVSREDQAQPRTLIVAAYDVILRGKTTDLYGLRFAADLFARLAADDDELQLRVFLSQPARTRRQRRYLRDIDTMLCERGFNGRYAILVGKSVLGAMGAGAVLLRPTDTDGDSVTVREALGLHVPVVASDAVARPTECSICPLHDVDAWIRPVRDALTRGGRDDAEPRPVTQDGDGWPDLERMYRALLAGTAP